MEKSLNEAKVKYHVGLGDYRFSPIIEMTTAIALDYYKDFEKNGIKHNNPLFFCFPEKKAASLWLAINLLTNFYLEDYVMNSKDKSDVLTNGDNVNVYGSILKFIRKKDDKIILATNDHVQIEFESKYVRHLSKSERINLNNYQHYAQNKKKVRINRNPISKILEPNEPVIINQKQLTSKILLIAGKGNTGSIRSLLKEIKVYSEPLSKIFPENENLIIKPDLESFKEVFNPESNTLISNFQLILNNLKKNTTLEELSWELGDLIEKLNLDFTITEEFNCEFERIIDQFLELEPKLDFVKKKYPGVINILPQNLKAVIINDISQIIEFPNTIKGFLKNGIPVIFTSNRKIEKGVEIEFFQQYFNYFEDCFRVNWNKKKILALYPKSNQEYVDKDFWEQCLRFANQKIEIEITKGNILDEIMPSLGKEICQIDDFEKLQTSFNRFLNLGYYAIKNSRSSNELVKKLISEFENIFNEVKNLDLKNNIVDLIELAINSAKFFQSNTKSYIDEENIFTNNFLLHDESKLFIPTDRDFPFFPNNSIDSITFTGFPYREYSGHYLWDSVCLFFVKNIRVLCWPNESKLTEKYIKRRLLAGYFTDNILDISLLIEKEFLLKSEIDFDNEINTYFTIKNLEEKTSEISFEGEDDNLEYLNNLIYKGYSSNSLRNDFKVKCNIITFTNGEFLFLPQGNASKILSETEDSNGNLVIRELNFNDLTVGLKIFKFRKDRSTYKEIASHNKIAMEAFAKLEFWKDTLESLYLSVGSDLGKLETLLIETKLKFGIEGGNPVRSNIQMWLFDDEKISPRISNLEIILRAAKVIEIDKTLLDLVQAYKVIVNGFYQRINKVIKNKIMNQLVMNRDGNQKMTLLLEKSVIEVDSRIIMSKERSDIEIDYQNTRKILC
jgi:hypothetical protein